MSGFTQQEDICEGELGPAVQQGVLWDPDPANCIFASPAERGCAQADQAAGIRLGAAGFCSSHGHHDHHSSERRQVLGAGCVAWHRALCLLALPTQDWAQPMLSQHCAPVFILCAGKYAVIETEQGLATLASKLDPTKEQLCVNVMEAITNVAEAPEARGPFAEYGAKEVLQRIHSGAGSNRLVRDTAAQCMRQLGFKHLPFEMLPGRLPPQLPDDA